MASKARALLCWLLGHRDRYTLRGLFAEHDIDWIMIWDGTPDRALMQCVRCGRFWPTKETP